MNKRLRKRITNTHILMWRNKFILKYPLYLLVPNREDFNMQEQRKFERQDIEWGTEIEGFLPNKMIISVGRKTFYEIISTFLSGVVTK